ncbi:SDR family NAD(P)-dependent oxidoreductase [Nitrospinota bacterium]
MPIRFEFTGRKVILTGAAGDIGRKILQGFLDADAKVFATDRPGERLDSLEGPSDQFKRAGCDLTDVSALRRTMRAALDWLGGCDVLCNVAGYMPIRETLGLTEEDWSGVLGVNLLAPYFAIQETIEALKASGSGRIISFASIAGKMGGIGPNIHYSAAKAGLLAMTFNLARELAKTGVTVNCVLPGPADTGLHVESPPGMLENAKKAHPLGRLTAPDDVWPAVLFLASEEAGHINGEALDVNGGFWTD